MPVMAGEKPYSSHATKTGSMLLPPPGVSKTVDRATLCSLDKTIHDFRSSLNVIIGNTEMMLDDVLGRTTPEQRDGLEDILASSWQIVNLVDEIANRQTPARL
jgi:hypothetical protein